MAKRSPVALTDRDVGPQGRPSSEFTGLRRKAPTGPLARGAANSLALEGRSERAHGNDMADYSGEQPALTEPTDEFVAEEQPCVSHIARRRCLIEGPRFGAVDASPPEVPRQTAFRLRVKHAQSL